jgi:hypothetical protein
MKSSTSSEFLGRLSTAFRAALRRGILGKSNRVYMKQFTGQDVYWKNVLAAQTGWPTSKHL